MEGTVEHPHEQTQSQCRDDERRGTEGEGEAVAGDETGNDDRGEGEDGEEAHRQRVGEAAGEVCEGDEREPEHCEAEQLGDGDDAGCDDECCGSEAEEGGTRCGGALPEPERGQRDRDGDEVADEDRPASVRCDIEEEGERQRRDPQPGQDGLHRVPV
ncbi:Uncharacterised protein [Mycobacteroides abscessus subsp. abscessus]|nr:Uncharacterised protein [Mycobacteroides abscessus subsp. abscessus]